MTPKSQTLEDINYPKGFSDIYLQVIHICSFYWNSTEPHLPLHVVLLYSTFQIW